MPSDPFVARASPSPCRAHCPTPQGSGCGLGHHAPRRTSPRCSRSTRQRFSQGKSEGLRSLQMCPLRSSLLLVYNHAWPLRFDSSSKSTDKSRYNHAACPLSSLTQPPLHRARVPPDPSGAALCTRGLACCAGAQKWRLQTRECDTCRWSTDVHVGRRKEKAEVSEAQVVVVQTASQPALRESRRSTRPSAVTHAL